MDEVKIGAMISNKNKKKLQSAHDALAELGVECVAGKSINQDDLVNFGDSIKATKLEDGNIKLAGYLVRFGDETKTDVTGDYFTKNTDFGNAETSEGWFNHRMPVSYKGQRVVYDEQLPDVKLTKDDTGVFAEIVLGARNEYEQIIAQMGFEGKLGWSSGTAPHLVDRKQVGNANEITRWHLGLDASLTPTPAEPRNTVMPIKSLITPEAGSPDKDDEGKQILKQETKKMDAIEFKAMLDDSNKSLTETIKVEATKAAELAVKSAIDALPEVKSGFNTSVIEIVKDEADREFSTIAEQLKSIKNYEVSKGRDVDPRLKRLDGTKAAVGLNEAVPSQGQFLLEPTISSEFFKPVHEAGVFSGKVKTLPVGANSNFGYINGIDETSRANGSRWGGVQGYWRAEATQVTSTKPKFRRINWELHALEVLMYATEEQLNDVPMTSAIVSQSAAEELNFKVNDAILNGDGVGKPLGVLNSPSLISATRLDANLIKHADILGMYQRLHPSFRGGAAWFVNSEAEPQLDALFFSTGSEGLLSPYIMYRPDGVMTIKGKPVFVTEFNPALGAVGDILLADFSQYLLWQKGGVVASVNPWIQWLTSEEAFKFTARVDGQSAYASAITPFKGTNTQSAFVALAATT